MASANLLEWLPEWDQATVVAARTDEVELDGVIERLVNLVFAEDAMVLDSLGDELESSLVGPLGILAQVSETGTLVEKVVAARLVKRVVRPYLETLPSELRDLIDVLPE
jgi:hypothetical protein